MERISSSSTWSSTSPVGQARVDVLRRARGDLAVGAEDELVADVVRRRGRLGRALGVDDELADAGRVAEVDEDEPAVVAALGHPARERAALRRRARGCELARSEVAPAHSDSTASASEENSSSWAPRRRTRRAVDAHDHCRLRAEPSGLRELALERAARRSPCRPRGPRGGAWPSPRARRPRGIVFDREEDVDLCCGTSAPCSVSDRTRRSIPLREADAPASAGRRSPRSGSRSGRPRRASDWRPSASPMNSKVVRV